MTVGRLAESYTRQQGVSLPSSFLLAFPADIGISPEVAADPTDGKRIYVSLEVSNHDVGVVDTNVL